MTLVLEVKIANKRLNESCVAVVLLLKMMLSAIIAIIERTAAGNSVEQNIRVENFKYFLTSQNLEPNFVHRKAVWMMSRIRTLCVSVPVHHSIIVYP